MQYKTICQNLIEQYPPLQHELRQSRMLLPMIERLAAELRNRHLALRSQLAANSPTADTDDPMLNAQALELAVAELQERFTDGWGVSEK